MKKIIQNKEDKTIELNQVTEDDTVFVKKDGKIVGVLAFTGSYYAIEIGKIDYLSSFSESKKESMEQAIKLGYELFIED